MTTAEKIQALKDISNEINSFKGLEIARNALHPVPGEGDPDSKIMFIGEAPGSQEDQTGRPFVGMSGQMMTRTLKEITGLDRSQVYITNIVKYRPPDNRDPSEEEIVACKEWLDRQIEIVSPEIIVTLGRFSMGKFISGQTISRIHGQIHQYGKYKIFPMFHPAAALRAGEVMKAFKADFLKLHELLKASINSSN